MIVPTGVPRDPLPDAHADAAVAQQRRRRLLRLVVGASLGLGAIALVAVLLPPAPRGTYLVSFCVLLVYCAALPLAASLLQYAVVGLHRFHTGYEHLRPHYPRVAVIVPAWNEGDVIGATIERLLSMDYPPDRLRVYVVDDASTDRTPDVVRAWEAREPARVRHLRRESGGEGKAHTLNHGIMHVLADPWAEAVLIIDADVLFEDTALRRMTRHLSDPAVGAVTAYIKEGTVSGSYLTRFIAYEYITAQAASRRAQNVFGALACLAGGAQLHSRRNLEALGGRIDTSSLAEDTVTTFRTQLSGKSVVFEGNAIVWAEEPGDLVGLWKQRLRWARGNVQISLQFSHMWLQGRRYGPLGRGLFAFIWFTVLLMPVFMAMGAAGLIALFVVDEPRAWIAFRGLWIFHAVIYVFVTAMSFALDPGTARRAWLQGIVFPGLISLGIVIFSLAPDVFGGILAAAAERLGLTVTPQLVRGGQVFIYAWLVASIAVAYLAKVLAERLRLTTLPAALIYLAGYGAFLCAVTVAAYVREIQGAGLTWDKTIKSGKVALPRGTAR